MKLLLDTQVMLWWLLGETRLRPETRELIASRPCVVSVASIWEVSIKHRLGKLPIDPAIFRDGCAACHAHPTIGRKGEALFVKACGICHQAEHRADMVPDLAQIPRAKDAAYWRGIIVHGKPGTIMPAFAVAEGGILDAAQVDSLVEYLVRAYPPTKPVDQP